MRLFFSYTILICFLSSCNDAQPNKLSTQKYSDDMLIDTCEYVKFRNKCKHEIKQFNDSINLFLTRNSLKFYIPPVDIDNSQHNLLNAYHNYCIDIFKSDEQYCFESYMDTLLSYESKYSTEEYPIIFNCDLGYPLEIEFEEVNFNNDTLPDYIAKLRIRSFGNGSYDISLAFTSRETTYEITEISTDDL